MVPKTDLRQGYRKSLYYSRVYESLHEVALQIAWNDNSEGAVEALLQEEVQVAVSGTVSLDSHFFYLVKNYHAWWLYRQRMFLWLVCLAERGC